MGSYILGTQGGRPCLEVCTDRLAATGECGRGEIDSSFVGQGTKGPAPRLERGLAPALRKGIATLVVPHGRRTHEQLRDRIGLVPDFPSLCFAAGPGFRRPT